MRSGLLSFSNLLALLLVLVAAPARAEQLNVIVNGKSHHFDSSYDWNEDNYGVGLEYQFATQSRWRTVAMASGLRDSNDQMSYMVGGGLQRRLFATERLAGFYVDAGINAFLMTREDVNDNRPFPSVLPSLSFGNRHLGFNLTYLPKIALEKMTETQMVDPTIDGVLFLQLKVSIDRVLPVTKRKRHIPAYNDLVQLRKGRPRD